MTNNTNKHYKKAISYLKMIKLPGYLVNHFRKKLKLGAKISMDIPLYSITIKVLCREYKNKDVRNNLN